MEDDELEALVPEAFPAGTAARVLVGGETAFNKDFFDLTDDDKLKREGKIDRAVSTVKDKVDDVADKVKDVFKK